LRNLRKKNKGSRWARLVGGTISFLTIQRPRYTQQQNISSNSITMAAVVAPSVPEAEDRPMDESELDKHLDDPDEEEEEQEDAPAKEWDEGGKSHCGYNEVFHDAIMKIGETIHNIVGDPNDTVHSAMKGIGNWFQEASYAARDVREGKMDVAEETAQAIKSMVTGDEGDKRNGGSGDDTGADNQYNAPSMTEEIADAPKLV
jgi:hypothetical protein